MNIREISLASLMSLPTAAILVTGGSAGTQVELLHGDGSPWCALPSLPHDRVDHTQTGEQIQRKLMNDQIFLNLLQHIFTCGSFQ